MKTASLPDGDKFQLLVAARRLAALAAQWPIRRFCRQQARDAVVVVKMRKMNNAADVFSSQHTICKAI